MSVVKISKSDIGRTILMFSLLSLMVFWGKAQGAESFTRAPSPLYRDPMYDGAADPALIWNREENSWWMLYTARRANQEVPDVAYCYGCDIGVASSKDNGKTWVYRGALNLNIEPGRNTFWAPDVLYYQGKYHLFVAYIQGAYSHWGGEKRLAHYTSTNLWDWNFYGFIQIDSPSVIDATLCQMPVGKWRIWYKDESRGSVTMTAESEDLFSWEIEKNPAIGGAGHEGPKVFRFQDSYWMLTDEWHGMRVYRSKDCKTWEKQGLILDGPSKRTDDTPSGAHGDVLVVKDREGRQEKAYVFYFTHPGREKHTAGKLDQNGVLPYAQRRSSIQVAELKFADGKLTCNREEDFDFFLPNPEALK